MKSVESALKGTSVRYRGGATIEQVNWGGNDDPRGVLVDGGIYKVLRVEPHTQHTKVYLEEFPSLKFNSVHFELVGVEKSLYWKVALKSEPDNYYIERPERLRGEDLIGGEEVGGGYILTVVEMSEEEFKALPEFTGF